MESIQEEPIPMQRNSLTESAEEDPWVVSNVVAAFKPWRELSKLGKVKRISWDYTGRQIALLILVYLFICSLNLLKSAGRLIAADGLNYEAFNKSQLLQNPIAGLIMGIWTTILLQSSSTTTSIIVAIVGAQLLDVSHAIPIIMGANIGTSVTNTLVSFGQAADRNQFRRAFGASTVHDMFNWLSVLILLPLECFTGYLDELSEAVAVRITESGGHIHHVRLLNVIITPVTKYILQLDDGAVRKIATDKNQSETIIKNQTEWHLFRDLAGVWPDWQIGVFLLLFSLSTLVVCLITLIKILNAIFRSYIAVILRRFINSDVPGKGKWGQVFTGCITILTGALLTLLIQSSSIFTSTLTPLAGIGVITLDRMYQLTLGSNLGTTITAIIASLAQSDDTESFERSIRISLCHLFFNLSGIILWYPIPFMKKLPLFLAKKLGNTTAKYRWFAIIYFLFVFFIAPGIVFGLSLAGLVVAASVLFPVAVIVVIIIIINVIQCKRRMILPTLLRDWEFLPSPLHSLRPYDRLFLLIRRRLSASSPNGSSAQ